MPSVGDRAARRRRRAPRPLSATRRRKEARGMADAELRVGVIGAGRWANWAHLPAWKRDLRCELVAVCDVTREAAEKAARDHEIPTATTDAHELLSNDDIDVIDIVTGDHSHF